MIWRDSIALRLCKLHLCFRLLFAKIGLQMTMDRSPLVQRRLGLLGLLAKCTAPRNAWCYHFQCHRFHRLLPSFLVAGCTPSSICSRNNLESHLWSWLGFAKASLAQLVSRRRTLEHSYWDWFSCSKCLHYHLLRCFEIETVKGDVC